MPREVDVRELAGRVIDELEQLVRDLAALRPHAVRSPRGSSGAGRRHRVPALAAAVRAAGARPRARRHRPFRGHDAATEAGRDPPDGRGRAR